VVFRYPEALYMLAMTDYLSRENELPLCTNYNDIRSMRLSEVIYPSGVHVMCMVIGSEHPNDCDSDDGSQCD